MNAVKERVELLHNTSTDNLENVKKLRDAIGKLYDFRAENGQTHTDEMMLLMSAMRISNIVHDSAEAIHQYYVTQLSQLNSGDEQETQPQAHTQARSVETAPPARKAVTGGRSAEAVRRDNEERMAALRQKAAEVANRQAAVIAGRESNAEATRQRAAEATARRAEQIRLAQEAKEQAMREVSAFTNQAVANAQPARVQSTRSARAPTEVTARGRVLTAYDRLMTLENSPLTKFFAPSPWFPEGKGTVTVGDSTFGSWNKEHEVDVSNFYETLRLPSGFYGDDDGKPRCAVLHLVTTKLVWYFNFEEGGAFLFHSVMNQAPQDRMFRPVEVCASSAIRRCLEELGSVYGMSVTNGLVIESGK